MWVNNTGDIRHWEWELQAPKGDAYSIQDKCQDQEDRIRELEQQITELQSVIEELITKVKPCNIEGIL